MAMGTDAVALLGGVASAVAVIATSFRRRQDVDLDELQKRVTDLTARLADAEEQIGHLRAQLVAAESRVFQLSRVLAANGIDPQQVEGQGTRS